MLKRLLISLAVLSAAALPIIASPAAADDLDVDLSQPEVKLNASFKGSELLLFGAKDLEGDVIVVVRGPTKDISMRRRERVAGIWVNTDEVVFKDAPQFYAVAATRPLDEILPPETLSELKIGVEHLALNPAAHDVADAGDFAAGLVRNMQGKELYTDALHPINTIGKQLFRTDIWFPSTVVVGNYEVETYLVIDHAVLSQNHTDIVVHKVGIEAQIYNFAHDYALWYGLLAILIAVVSGWTANAIFKKRG